MRRPTLLELVVWCCVVYLLVGLFLPARQPQELRPPHELVLQGVGNAALGLALAGGAAVAGAWFHRRVLAPRSYPGSDGEGRRGE